jgi:hypothetical protein
MKSAPPPAANGTIILIALLGKALVWALALLRANAAEAARPAVTVRLDKRFMGLFLAFDSIVGNRFIDVSHIERRRGTPIS